MTQIIFLIVGMILGTNSQSLEVGASYLQHLDSNRINEVTMDLKKSNGTTERRIKLADGSTFRMVAQVKLTKGAVQISVKQNSIEVLNETFTVTSDDQPVQLQLSDLEEGFITITTTLKSASGHYEMSWS